MGIESPQVESAGKPSLLRYSLQAGLPSNSSMTFPFDFVTVKGYPIATNPWVAWGSIVSVGSENPTANAPCSKTLSSTAW